MLPSPPVPPVVSSCWRNNGWPKDAEHNSYGWSSHLWGHHKPVTASSEWVLFTDSLLPDEYGTIHCLCKELSVDDCISFSEQRYNAGILTVSIL